MKVDLGSSEVIGALERLVRLARWRATQGVYDGRVNAQSKRLLRYCTYALPLSPEHQASLIYTRDAGHHSSGWWKNPDYERCYHLSLSYRDQRDFLPHDRKTSAAIARVFWPKHFAKAWVEAPYSPEGHAAQVWHYRLFCDPSWAPILPRGEVYGKENTPSGWRSFSEVHGLTPDQIDAPFLLAASE